MGVLVATLAAAGVEGTICRSIDDLLARVLAATAPGDVLVTMSSGAFEGLPHRLLRRLEAAA